MQILYCLLINVLLVLLICLLDNLHILIKITKKEIIMTPTTSATAMSSSTGLPIGSPTLSTTAKGLANELQRDSNWEKVKKAVVGAFVCVAAFFAAKAAYAAAFASSSRAMHLLTSAASTAATSTPISPMTAIFVLMLCMCGLGCVNFACGVGGD